jgi:hypothetical protein
MEEHRRELLMKRLLVICLCVAVGLMMSGLAYSADKDAPKDTKAKTECSHSKDCKVCKDKGKENCPKHKDCCAKKGDKKKNEKKSEEKK